MNEGKVKVGCHLCGEIWSLPDWVAADYGPDRPYECIDCRSGRKRLRIFEEGE